MLPGSSVRENCFREIFENANRENLALFGIFHCNSIIIAPTAEIGKFSPWFNFRRYPSATKFKTRKYFNIT